MTNVTVSTIFVYLSVRLSVVAHIANN